MKILAIDPGYDKVGIAVLEKKPKEKESLLFSECFSPYKNIKKNERILEVGKRVKEIIKKYKVEALAIESLFFNKNHKTALVVAEAKGVITYESGLVGIFIEEFTPLQVKMAITGNGKSDKNQVNNMVSRLIDLKGKKPKDDDEYDAIAVGLTFFAFQIKKDLGLSTTLNKGIYKKN